MRRRKNSSVTDLTVEYCVRCGFPVLLNPLLRILRDANFSVLFCPRALFKQRARTKHRTRQHSRSDIFTTLAQLLLNRVPT